MTNSDTRDSPQASHVYKQDRSTLLSVTTCHLLFLPGPPAPGSFHWVRLPPAQGRHRPELYRVLLQNKRESPLPSYVLNSMGRPHSSAARAPTHTRMLTSSLAVLLGSKTYIQWCTEDKASWDIPSKLYFAPSLCWLRLCHWVKLVQRIPSSLRCILSPEGHSFLLHRNLQQGPPQFTRHTQNPCL